MKLSGSAATGTLPDESVGATLEGYPPASVRIYPTSPHRLPLMPLPHLPVCARQPFDRDVVVEQRREPHLGGAFSLLPTPDPVHLSCFSWLCARHMSPLVKFPLGIVLLSTPSGRFGPPLRFLVPGLRWCYDGMRLLVIVNLGLMALSFPRGRVGSPTG